MALYPVFSSLNWIPAAWSESDVTLFLSGLGALLFTAYNFVVIVASSDKVGIKRSGDKVEGSAKND